MKLRAYVRKKRIMFITNSFKGLFLFRREIIKSLSKTHSVILVGPSSSSSEMFSEEEFSLDYFDLSLHGLNPFKELKTIWQLNKITKLNNPDYIFTFTIKPNIYVGLISRFRTFNFIPNVTGQGKMGQKKGLIGLILKVMYRTTFKRTKTIFFQNQRDLQVFQVKKIVAENTELLPGSGVNIKYFEKRKYPKGKAIQFLFVGRIIQEKGIEYYLRLAEDYQSNDRISFHVVGPLSPKYSAIISQLNGDNIIVYHGSVDDIRGYYEMCHCLIHPTYYAEGMSNVLLEASATGRPVIATLQPGTQETFIDGVSGFGFKPQDYQQLKQCVERFIKLSLEEKIEMGINARNYVEANFDRNYVIEAYTKTLL